MPGASRPSTPTTRTSHLCPALGGPILGDGAAKGRDRRCGLPEDVAGGLMGGGGTEHTVKYSIEAIVEKLTAAGETVEDCPVEATARTDDGSSARRMPNRAKAAISRHRADASSSARTRHQTDRPGAEGSTSSPRATSSASTCEPTNPVAPVSSTSPTVRLAGAGRWLATCC